MIDVHVHFRDWNQAHKETLEHGLRHAAALGFTAVCDMPNTDPPLTSLDLLKKRIADAQPHEKKYGIQYYCYGGVTANTDQIKNIVRAASSLERVIGLKYFASHSTGNMGVIDEQHQRQLFTTLAEEQYTGLLAIHAEDTALFTTSSDPHILTHHHQCRPVQAEISAVQKQISFAKAARFTGHIHICHITNTGVLDLIESQRPQLPFTLTAGATSSHLLLNLETASSYCKINPPIRPEATRKKLYAALLDGRIDWVESDHAPHTRIDKKNGVSGIPALLGQIRLLHQLYQDNADPALISSLFGNRAKKLLGIDCPITIPSQETCKTYIKKYADEYPFNPYE